MTELDFDELDKAVNNLMTTVGTDTPNTPTLQAEPGAIAATPTFGATPTTPTPTTVSAPLASQSTNATAPPANRRRGQFMDVVRPSSAMSAGAQPAINRQGITLQPTTPNVAPEPPAAPVESPAIVAMPAFDMESTGMQAIEAATTESSVVDVPASTVDEPAPLESSPSEPAASSAASDDELPTPRLAPITPVASPVDPLPAADAVPTADESLVTVISPEPTELTAADDTNPAPLTSPFLADAKVEKRPLGELASEVPAITAFEAPTPAAEPNSLSQPTEQPAVALPEELQTDVVAVESATTTPDNALTPGALAMPITEAPAAPVQAVGIAPTGSIPLQYTESPSTGDQTNGSIYDTAHYHTPVEAPMPVKKSSPVKWIIWVLLLLIVGAAAGAAYFYFTR